MPLYESVFIVRQDLSPVAADEVAKGYVKVMEKQEGKVEKFENWGLRDLAYRLRKNRKGYYFLFNIAAEPPAVVEMERLMRLDNNILRCLAIRVEKHQSSPSPLASEKREEPKANEGGKTQDE